jgi:hypothetical protein
VPFDVHDAGLRVSSRQRDTLDRVPLASRFSRALTVVCVNPDQLTPARRADRPRAPRRRARRGFLVLGAGSACPRHGSPGSSASTRSGSRRRSSRRGARGDRPACGRRADAGRSGARAATTVEASSACPDDAFRVPVHVRLQQPAGAQERGRRGRRVPPRLPARTRDVALVIKSSNARGSASGMRSSSRASATTTASSRSTAT